MKKIILTTCLVLLFAVNVFGATGKIIDNKTYVPVRGVFEEIGFNVSYDSSTGTAIISNESYNISIPKDKTYFMVNGKSIKPDTPQRIVDGSMYLPLRAVGDSVGAVTSWDSSTKTAKIELNGKTSTVTTSTSNTQSNKKSILNFSEIGRNGNIYYKLDPAAEKQMVEFVESNIKNGYGGEDSVPHMTLDYPQTAEFKNEQVAIVTDILPTSFDFDYTRFAPGRKYYAYVGGQVISQTSAGVREQKINSACVLFNVTDNKLADMVLAFTIF